MMVGALNAQVTKPFRWEIRSRESLGFIHEAGEAYTQDDAAKHAAQALVKYLHLGGEAVILRAESREGREVAVEVETFRGEHFGNPPLNVNQAMVAARAIHMRARELDEAAGNWAVARDREEVRLGQANYGPTRPAAKGPEDLEAAKQRFFGALEALRAVLPQPE